VRDYIVEITTTGATDKFRYSDDGRLTWSAEKAITDIQPGRPQYVHDLSHNIEIKFVNATGHTGSEEWAFTRKPSQLYNPQDIAVDANGDLWVIDKGAEGDRFCIKKFAPNGAFYEVNFYRDWGTDPDYFSHGLAYFDGNLFSCHGELSGDNTYFNKVRAEDGETLAIWGKQGTGPSEHLSGQQCAIAQHGAQHTLLGTDWFVCKVTEWDLNGGWVRTIQLSLRSDAYCIKCKNPNAGAEKLYRRVSLSDGDYTVQFLAFTDGNGPEDAPPITTISDHVVPYAAKVPQGGGPPATNQIQPYDMTYQPYVVTKVAIPDDPSKKNRYAWFVTGDFRVDSGQSGDWDVGTEVEGKPAGEDARRVYIASLTCFKRGDL
jgi:hypothetical protein